MHTETNPTQQRRDLPGRARQLGQAPYNQGHVLANPALEHRPASGMEKLGNLLRKAHPDLVISKRRMRKAEFIECVRMNREASQQVLGFSSRPFVLCGLPVKMPAPGCLLHERRNGQFVLQVTGHPSYGVPWGQDRLVPIFLATLAVRQQTPRITFDSAAEMLDTFGCSRAVRSIAV
jgi:hypothetical protein